MEVNGLAHRREPQAECLVDNIARCGPAILYLSHLSVFEVIVRPVIVE
jgi:hypothetical protein